MLTMVTFLCIFYYHKKKKKAKLHKGRTGEKTTTTKLWKLESYWLVLLTTLISTTESLEGSGSAASLEVGGGGIRGWDSLQGMAWSCLRGPGSPPHPPTTLFPAAVWLPPQPQQKPGDFLENINQEAACSLDDVSRQEERPKDVIIRMCNWQAT